MSWTKELDAKRYHAESIIRAFYARNGRSPSLQVYLRLQRKEYVALSQKDIVNNYGTYNKYIESLGYRPRPPGVHSGNDLWLEIRKPVTDTRMREIAAEMFADVDWSRKGAYGPSVQRQNDRDYGATGG